MTPGPMQHKPTAGALRAAMFAAALLMTVALLGSVAIHLIFGSRHFWAASYINALYLRKYAHAHYHLMQQIAGVWGLCTVALMLIWIPFWRRERWSWWALLVAGGFLYGANWLTQALLGLTDPPLIPNSAQAILGSIFAAGLLLGCRVVCGKTPSPNPE